ncbi:MAG TPA: ABC transporter permease [Mycobacteriales bacterium]|nr:ABC transporter permease [Mycobacteriales bacterium]
MATPDPNDPFPAPTAAGVPGTAVPGAPVVSATPSGPPAGGSVEPRTTSQLTDIRRRFFRNRLAVVGLGLITLLVVVAAFAPWLAPHDPLRQDLTNTLAGPSGEHLLGTDVLGRDQLSRIIYGSRVAIVVGLASILIAVVIGVALGAVAGYFGRFWDSLIMRVADVFFAFPLLIGAIIIIVVVGRGVLPVVIALAVFSWATVARLLRSSILSVRESEYVEAARSLGASRWRIVTRHVLPNSLAPVLVYATFNVGTAVVATSALSFLGVGVSPEVPEWGNMIAAGRGFVGVADYLWIFPSVAIVLTVLGFVFAGDGLRDALDPKLR